MNLWSLAWKNLRRRPTRSLLTTLGLTVAVAAVVSLVGVAQSLESSFLALYTKQGADLVVQRRGGTVQLAKGLPLALSYQIRDMPEVKSVIAGLMDMIAFPDDGLFMVIANGWEPDCSVLQRVTMLKGRRLEAGDRDKCMLGKILAANLHKKVGDKVELYSQPFEVIGIFESFSVYENGAVFMLMDELQKQMDRPGQATGFIVEANPRGDQRVIEKLRTKIESLDPSIAATPCEEFVRGINQMQVTRTMSWVTAAIAVFLGSIGVLNTMAMSVLERKTEIGALRAMGWRKSRVISLIVSESLILALGAAVSGVTLGLAITFALSKWKSTSVLIQGNWSISAIVTGIVLAGLMAILGAMYPAARVARTKPIDALRG